MQGAAEGHPSRRVFAVIGQDPGGRSASMRIENSPLGAYADDTTHMDGAILFGVGACFEAQKKT